MQLALVRVEDQAVSAVQLRRRKPATRLAARTSLKWPARCRHRLCAQNSSSDIEALNAVTLSQTPVTGEASGSRFSAEFPWPTT